MFLRILGFLFFFVCVPPNASAEKFTAPYHLYSDGWDKFKSHTGYSSYICEFAYRKLADHVIDPNNREFDPSVVQAGDSIYVAVWYLDWFTSTIHDKILHPYVLITCDVGAWLPSPNHMKLIYDPKVACWFGKNMMFTNHSKFFQLPMGHFYSLWTFQVAPHIGTLSRLVKEPKDKDILVYLNYTERKHGRRDLVADLFWNQPYCFNRNRPRLGISFCDYWDEVSRSKFVLSPLGLEIDCTRTWECFILGAIPIVEHSFLDPLYDHLPILLVHDWKEINEEYLDRKYEEIQNKPVAIERAYIDYWADLIHQKQEMIRSGDCQMSALESSCFDSHDLGVLRGILTDHNKLNQVLIYQGNMTCLRPFQVAKNIPEIPFINLLDLWTDGGISHIRKFSQDPTLFDTNRVNILDPSMADWLFANPGISIFLDLTHFRHKLMLDLLPLTDFCHSLEADIQFVYDCLVNGELLIGNMSHDPYVCEVLERLACKQNIMFEQVGHFWFCIK